MKKTHSEQRRAFIKKLAFGIGSTGLLATQGKLQLIQSAMAATSDYSGLTDHKSLVCVFLFGGNDAFNMMVPYEQNAYNQYQNARTNLALARNSLLPLNGNQQAFHPSMPDLQNLYNSNKLSVVTNVGALIEPTTRDTYINKSVQLPADLFSHNHQQEFWQSGSTAKTSTRPPGWGGRMMDLLITANDSTTDPALFSVAGNSIWQRGLQPLDFVLNPYNGVEQIEAFASDTWPYWKSSRISAWDKILKLNNSSLLNQQMTSAYKSSAERISALIGEIAQAQTISTPYPSGNNLARQLKMVAKMISIRENLGMKRQIFFVALGGWDTHGNQLGDHANKLKTLNDALNSFYQTTVELGVSDSVTTFTASEFGRSYSINGDGTDHAWAGHNLIMGDAIRGGQIHGDPIDLTINGPDDAEDTGRFIPKYGIDQYGATLGSWMGMTDSDLHDIFPNLANFNEKNLGFMV